MPNESSIVLKLVTLLHDHWPQALAGFAFITWIYKRVKNSIENPVVRKMQILECEHRINAHSTALFKQLMEKQNLDIRRVHQRIDAHLNKNGN